MQPGWFSLMLNASESGLLPKRAPSNASPANLPCHSERSEESQIVRLSANKQSEILDEACPEPSQRVHVEQSSTLTAGRGTAVDLSSAVGQPLAQLLKRPEITIEQLATILKDLVPRFFERGCDASSPVTAVANAQLPLSSEVRNELKSVETEIKYAGYLDQQQRAIDRLKKAEQRRIPDWFDYRAVSGLSREMQEKLGKVTPQTLGQASSIPGVTPAAVSLINVYIEIQGRRRAQAAAL